MKKQFFIIDTSAILSGKPITLEEKQMVTSPAVSAEVNPGGRDHRNFEFLVEKGLVIRSPSESSKHLIQQAAKKTGDLMKLSVADIEILALAIDINKEKSKEAIVLTDDYAVQNVSSTLNIKFQGFSQRGIRKKFKWNYRCPGCGKQFQDPIKNCPICGTQTKITPLKKERI